MKNEKIGIVIPVYNSDEYLKETLKCIQYQTYKNIEIILIDDESDDNSNIIIRHFCDDDPRFKVDRIKHSGVTAARNRGVVIADSDLIIFIDSDDIIEEDYIEKLYMSMNADIVIDNLYCNDLNEEKKIAGYLEAGYYKNIDYILKNMIVYNEGYGIWPSLCGKIMKRDILLKVQEDIFDNIYYGEDRCVLYDYLLRCQSVHIVNIGGYCYINHNNSSTHRVYDDFLCNINKLYLTLKEIFGKHYLADSLIYQLQVMVYDMILHSSINMGFPRNLTCIRYRLNTSIIENSKIVLYGAGNVGIDYYKQLMKTKNIELVAWVDKYIRKLKGTDINIFSPLYLKDIQYDYILVGILQEEKYKEIFNELLSLGVSKNKIIWSKPNINELIYY